MLFLGLDGADWQHLDALMAEGAMPNLAALVAEGRRGVLTTNQPPLSPLLWTTMMTGVSPLEHRVLDFTRFHPTTGAREPIASTERRVPAIWNMASAAGRSVAVFGLWATWPAEEVRGTIVSDRLFSFHAPGPTKTTSSNSIDLVFPPDRLTPVSAALADSERAIDATAVAEFLVDSSATEVTQALSGDTLISGLRRILVETVWLDTIARREIETAKPDLTIVYFEGTDAIGHLFAPFVAPPLAGTSERDARRFGQVPRRYFERIDQMLGRYRELAQQQGAILFLASDHGFRWREGRPRSAESADAAGAALWHRDEGIYLLAGPGIEHGSDAAPASVNQVTATLLTLLGLPPGKGLFGPPLSGLSAGERTPVDYRTGWQRAAESKANPGGGDEDLAELSALGYLGGNESSSAPQAARASDEPSRTPGSWNNEGALLRQAGRVDEAAAAFEQALALDPRSVSARFNLSELLVERDAVRADALLLDAVRDGLPEASSRVLARISQLGQRREAERAQKLLDRALDVLPQAPDLWLARGRLRLEAEQCRAALADFERAQTLAPESALPWGSLALAHLCLGQETQAEEALKRSLALDPNQPEVARVLAEISG